MANLLKAIARRALFPKSHNLASFRDPFTVMRQLLAGKTVTNILDAGASHGRISMKLSRLFPQARIHAFEPQPLYRDKLTQLHAEHPAIVPHFAALSDTEGSIDLHIARSPGITSLFRPASQLEGMFPDETSIVSVAPVDTVTIDAWVERNGNPPLEVMKFDIQGGELAALRGAQRTLQASTLLIYTEILFNSLYEGGAIYSEIDLLLRNNGFMLHDIYKPRYNDKGSLMWANAIFIHARKLGQTG